MVGRLIAPKRKDCINSPKFDRGDDWVALPLDFAESNMKIPTGLATVRNGTVWLPFRRDDECMKHKHGKKELSNATRASVIIEMAKPRMAKSARIIELNIAPERISRLPSISLPGTVDKIIPASDPNGLEKAQISLDGAPKLDRAIRIENTLTDESGCEVRLKKGAHVKVTVTAKNGGHHS